MLASNEDLMIIYHNKETILAAQCSIISKEPPAGGIAGFRLRLPDFVGCSPSTSLAGGIEIGRVKSQ